MALPQSILALHPDIAWPASARSLGQKSSDECLPFAGCARHYTRNKRQAASERNNLMNRLSYWEIFYSFLIIVPMAAFMTIGDYILRKRATGN